MKDLHLKCHHTPGILITFCGLDGCGKTTLIKMLQQYFIDLEIQPALTRQPTDFVRNSAIFRTYMDSPYHDQYDYRALSLLAASDRVQHSNNVILPALERGDVIISDRYFYSCYANLLARGYTQDQWIYEIARSIPMPDLAFFIDSSVETAVKRVRSRPEEKDRYIDMQLQYRLQKAYLQIARHNKGVVLSSEQPLEMTYFQMIQAVSAVLQENTVRK